MVVVHLLQEFRLLCGVVGEFFDAVDSLGQFLEGMEEQLLVFAHGLHEAENLAETAFHVGELAAAASAGRDAVQKGVARWRDAGDGRGFENDGGVGRGYGRFGGSSGRRRRSFGGRRGGRCGFGRGRSGSCGGSFALRFFAVFDGGLGFVGRGFFVGIGICQIHGGFL